MHQVIASADPETYNTPHFNAEMSPGMLSLVKGHHVDV